MARALFEEIFDGPDSLFGRIFGPSREKLAQTKSTIRVQLTPELLKDIGQGKIVCFETEHETIQIMRKV